MSCKTAVLGVLLLLPVLLYADQNDERLEDLFQELKVAENSVQAYPIETRIWQLWLEHDNPVYQGMMDQGIAQMNSNAMRAALTTFSRLIEQAPDYAEAWNKRATVYYLLGDYKASEEDIAQTLKLEPWHFGALSGLGLVCLAQKQYLRARTAFNSALEVYPAMEGVRRNLELLNQKLSESSI